MQQETWQYFLGVNEITSFKIFACLNTFICSEASPFLFVCLFVLCFPKAYIGNAFLLQKTLKHQEKTIPGLCAWIVAL